jgi:hypothetical protein
MLDLAQRSTRVYGSHQSRREANFLCGVTIYACVTTICTRADEPAHLRLVASTPGALSTKYIP